MCAALAVVFLPLEARAVDESPQAHVYEPPVAVTDEALIAPTVIPKIIATSTLDDTQQIALAFQDAPIMVHIAEAEAPDGKGGVDCNQKNPNSSAEGCFQILTGTWNGYNCTGDRRDVNAGIACARKIYEARGTVDWNASKSSWGKYL